MRHIYPYSEKNYILGSLNDYYYHSYMTSAEDNISLSYKMKLFFKLNKFNLVNYKLLFFFKYREILLLDLTSFLIYFIDNINIKYNSNCYIATNTINIKDKKYNILSTSYIPIKYLFNFAKKEYLTNIKMNKEEYLFG